MIFGLFGGAKKRSQELVVAARGGDLTKVRELLEKGADIDFHEEASGDTPLIAAADGRHAAILDLLLVKGAKPDLTDSNGQTALVIACCAGDTGLVMVTRLLDAGANTAIAISSGQNQGGTALQIAATLGANDNLRLLLARGAKPTVSSMGGTTPLHSAGISGNPETVAILLAAGADVSAVNAEKMTPLHFAAATGNAGVATALVDAGAKTETYESGVHPLMLASAKGQTELVRLLLDRGAYHSAPGKYDGRFTNPLAIAASAGNEQIVRMLLAAGASADEKLGGPTVLDIVERDAPPATVAMLRADSRRRATEKKEAKTGKQVRELEARLLDAIGASERQGIDEVKSHKLFNKIAADLRLLVHVLYGEAKAARKALSEGANANALTAGNGLSLTPLHACTISEDIEILNLLLDAGADPSVTNSEGLTPLMTAARTCSAEFVARLGRAGCLECAESHGLTPFGIALDAGRMDIAQLLLDLGAVPSFGTVETLPLSAIEHGDLKLLQTIVAKGGTIVPPSMPERAAFVAARQGDPEVFDYVLQQGADPAANNELAYSPLTLAVLNGHEVLVERFLERGDDPDHADSDRETALSLAIDRDNPRMVNMLRTRGAQRRAYPGLDEPSAMLQGAAEGALGTLLDLRDAGVSLNVTDDAGNTPLMQAVRAGHLGVVRALFHLGADINRRNQAGESGTSLAEAGGNPDMMATMKEFVTDDVIASMGGSPILQQVGGVWDAGNMMFGRGSHPGKDKPPYAGDEESHTDDESEEDVEEEGCESDDTDETELSDEVLAGAVDRLEQLLESSHVIAKLSPEHRQELEENIATFRSEGRDALGDEPLQEFVHLAEDYAKYHAEQELLPPIFLATNQDDPAAIRKLVKAGGVPDTAAPDGTTPLMVAAERGLVRTARELIKLGAKAAYCRPDSFTPLLNAVFAGSTELVKLLLESGAEINRGHTIPSSRGPSGGQTALMVAAVKQNLPLVKLLVKAGADLHAVSESGYSPLMWGLANAPDGQVAKFLLQSGAEPDPDVESRLSWAPSNTPLNLAATNGLLDVVRALIDAGADLDKPDGMGWTPLKHAAESGHADIVKFLLKEGAQADTPDLEGWTGLMNAAAKGHLAVVQLLLKAGANANACSNSGVNPLGQAVGARLEAVGRAKTFAFLRGLLGQDGDDEADAESLKLVKVLLKAGADPNTLRDGVPLIDAARQLDDEPLIELLEKAGAIESEATAGGDDDQITELLRAASEGDAEEISRLIDEEGADPSVANEEGITPLMLALGSGDDASVQALLDAGAVPIAHRDDGKSPLFMAIAAQRPDWVVTLLDAGAQTDEAYTIDHNGEDVPGCSPLYLAAFIGALEITELLIERSAEIEACNEIGHTVLMAAIQGGHEDVVACLLEAGADPDPLETSSHPGFRRTTPLAISAQNGALEVARLLLEHGADVNALPENHWSPLKSAVKGGHRELIDLFLDRGADIDIADESGYTALMNAVTQDDDSIALELIARGAKLDCQCLDDWNHGGRNRESPQDDDSEWKGGRSALMDAAEAGKTAMVQHLIDAGANLDLQDSAGDTAFRLALSQGHFDTAACLLESGANPQLGNAGMTTLLTKGSVEVLARLGALGLRFDMNVPLYEGLLPLALAVGGGNHPDVVVWLIRQGANPNASLSNGYPILGAAIHRQDSAAARALIAGGADPNALLPGGMTLLGFALRQNDEACVKILLDAKADIHYRVAGARPVDLAVIYGRMNLVPLLIRQSNQASAEIDQQDTFGRTRLMRSVVAGDLDEVRTCINAGADLARRNCTGDSPLSLACRDNKQEIVQLLRQAKAEQCEIDPTDDRPPINQAADAGALGTLLDLLDDGADINSLTPRGNSILFAGGLLHPGLIRIAVARGARLDIRNNEGRTPLADARLREYALAEKLLLELGATNETVAEEDEDQEDVEIHSSGDEATTRNSSERLLEALHHCDLKGAAKVIAAGADLNAENEEAGTPLFAAGSGLLAPNSTRRERRDRLQLIDLLLDHGANPCIGERSGLCLAAVGRQVGLLARMLRCCSPCDPEALYLPAAMSLRDPGGLRVAEEYPKGECIRLLLDAGMFPAVTDDDSMTLFHYAAESNAHEALRFLIKSDPAPVAVQNTEGNTPLHLAAEAGHLEAAQLLREAGASLTLRNGKGCTPRDCAMRAGHSVVAALLETA